MSWMKGLVLGALLFVSAIGIYAQEYSWDWATQAVCVFDDYGNAIATDNQGNQYITGSFSDTINFGSIALTNGGTFVAKQDSDGNFIWAVQSGGTSSCYAYSIGLDEWGNIYISGGFEGTASFGSTTLTSIGDEDIFTAKLNSRGIFLWATKSGGTSDERSWGIAVDSFSNSYITGSFSGMATFGTSTITSSGNLDVFAAKLDPNGNFLWAKKAGSTNHDRGYGIAVDNQNNVYLTGFVMGPATFGTIHLEFIGSSDMFAAKLDSSGNWLWATKAGGSSAECGYAIAVDSSANVYLTGNFYSTVMFGATQLVSSGYDDVFVTKLDSAGNFLWAKRAGGIWNDVGQGIAADDSGNSYVTGYYHDTVTFGPYTLYCTGTDDIFIAKLDSSGNYLWAKQAGGYNYDYGNAVAIDAAANVYLTGYFMGTSNFGPFSLTSTWCYMYYGYYSADVFVAKLSSGVAVDDDLAPEISGLPILSDAYPNPFHQGETATIKTNIADRDSGTLSIFDLRGRCVASYQISSGEQQITLDSQNLTSGIYLYQLQTQTAKITKKLVLLN